MSFKILTPRVKTKFIAPALPKLIEPAELEGYIDPDPEIRKFLQAQKEKEFFKRPPPKLKIKEKLDGLEEEVAELRKRNEELKADLKRARHVIASRKSRKKRRLEKAALKEKKKYEELSQQSKCRIIAEVWKNLADDYGEKSAGKIITKIYYKHGETDEKRKMTAEETLNMIKRAGISVSAMRKIRHELREADVHNPFASDGAVNQERKRIGDLTSAETTTPNDDSYEEFSLYEYE